MTEELHELLSAACDESIDAKGEARLEELLRTRPEARTLYREYLRLHANLRDKVRVDVDLGRNLDPATPRAADRAPRWRALPAAAALFLAALIGFVIVRSGTEEETGPAVYRNRPVFGINLSSVNDFGTERPFVDLLRYARPWKRDDYSTDAEQDALGNPAPGQEGRIFTAVANVRSNPGPYVLSYAGTGDFKFAKSLITVFRREPGRIEFEVKTERNSVITLELSANDPADPVRDLRLRPLNLEHSDDTFDILFIERLAPFGTIRFMNWQRINRSSVASWPDRTPEEASSYNRPSGVPVEVMIDLANRLRVRPWFNMPHRADDEFVRSFAAAVKDGLDPELTPYVEYSNGVWDPRFEQAHHARREGMANLGAPDKIEGYVRFYTRRAAEIFRIWEAELGKSRFVRVLGSEFDRPEISERLLAAIDGEADVLAVAPYFGKEFGLPEREEEVDALTIEGLLDEVEKNVRGRNRDLIRAQAAVARKYGIPLVAYEGGQHLAGVGKASGNDSLRDLFIAVNRHPRMYDLYRLHLETWFAEGGGLYNTFVYVNAPGRSGSWGLLEVPAQPLETAHKYRAVRDFIRDAELPRD